MDREVLLEALSALTGATVMPHIGSEGIDIAELTVHNFVSCALVPLILCKDEPTTDEANADTPAELLVNMDNFLDPRYNYDFRGLSDTSPCVRGDEPYTRPCGWFRFALKVLDKYPDGNAWLGPLGWRNHSVAGEWPVSYHGTGREGINKSNPHQAQEFGIYSTPDIKMAETDEDIYKEFKSKNGKSYRVIMQNRINPAERIKKSDQIWLIKIPLEVYVLDAQEQRKEEMRKIVDRSIRPYGILLKEM
ncbi:uncharacterized protein LOC143521863 [Brachyhypopomus gauderio]|uniref:uncharacterized protein LOC143521863 n=1 Tax=Brachyhypopomus gauderio TaxID=698409 RepID=UPI004041AFCD